MSKSESDKKDAKPQFLTIQKVVKLMSPFHLEEFKKHLQETKANIPLRLVEAINDSLTAIKSSDELCRKVYGKHDAQTRKSFNQLASHTFRLTAFLSRNYPGYLLHNISRIEVLIGQGNLIEANILADILLDIAEKTGDNHTQILVLKFLVQQAQMYKNQAESIRFLKKIDKLLEAELALNTIYLYVRSHFNVSIKDDSVLKHLDRHLGWFGKYYKHESPAVRMLSRFSFFFVTYYYRPTDYLTTEMQKQIREFDAEVQRNAVHVLPFMEDLYSKFLFYKLNLSTTDLNSRDGKNEYQKLLIHNRYLKFWQNYVNVPELYAITIKSTYFLSRYHRINHRNNFRSIIPTEDLDEITRLTARCEELIKLDIWDPDHINDLIHFRLTWSALLLLGETADIKKGVDNLEKLMTSYQQLAFSESMDSIFVCLMIGYFAGGNHKMCVETFKRYIKLAKGRVVNGENDLEIHTYYYTSRWLSTQRKQYLRKLSENYNRAGKHQSRQVIQQTVLELVNYFNIPLSLQVSA